MEDTTSGNDLPLLTKLRALARRGAVLRREAGGGGSVLQPVSRTPGKQTPAALSARMTPEDMLHALDRGWLKESGAEQMILSKRGATMLRVALNRAAVAAAACPVAAPAGAPAPAPPHARPQVNASESPLAWLRSTTTRTAGR